MNTKIERSQLKRNFLKEIIMRLDFQGVFQIEMEKVISDVKPYLKEKQFTRYNEKANNQTLIEGASVKETTSQIVYSFANDNTGYTLDLSVTSIVLNIRNVGYSPFEEYSDIFLHIVSSYSSQIDFFTVTRFGFRKINYCFVKNLSDIGSYFEPKYYDVDNPIEGFNIGVLNRTSQLSSENKKINLRYIIEQGEIERENYFKVTFDSDVFSTDIVTINGITSNKDELYHINNTLFQLYCDAITDKMSAILLDDECDLPEGLVGIESNE